VTKSARILLAVTCAGLLLLGAVGSARHAYAQDAGETDGNIGAWSAPDAYNSEQSPTKVKTHPLNIKGCWSGHVMDSGDGLGTAAFQFEQNSNRKKLVIGSTFNFGWSDGAAARGPMKGKVTSTGFTFTGNAGTECAVTGNGMGDDTALTGTFEFTGDCAAIFQDVTFSITPGCP
jgi:hypothetical protein